jgi:predicted nucleic acid-binding protein
MEATMQETRTAKPFKNGASQAVRLPAEFRFEGTEVYATRDDQTIGDMDMMIAAHALAVGAVLVTNNTRRFARIAAPLMLANWRG